MFNTKIQIRFSDCDMLSHVNNAVYLQYFETARIHFFNQELPNWDWTKQGIILARNTIDYIKPVFLDDACEIEVYCTQIGNSSFTLAYNVKVCKNDKIILKSTGESILVCFDFLENKTIPIPLMLLKVLKKAKVIVSKEI
ncbi:MAG: acyl-CoA thioesterase [Crocinitomicaceae bacterium]